MSNSILAHVERLQEAITAAIPDERPHILSPRMEGLREELRKFPHWVVWEAVWEDDPGAPHGGRWLKIPYNPSDGTHANANAPQTWGRFETAVDAYERGKGRYAGLGFMLADDDPFTIFVVDGAIADDDTLLPEAARIVSALKTYAEVAADGRGIQLILKANLPPGGRRRGAIEMHESDGFIALTGRQYDGTPHRVQKRQAEIEALHADVFPPPSHAQRDKEPRISPFANSPAAVNDKDLLALAFHTANGPRIEALYTGKTSSINGDRNAADLALCSMLGFYTGDDPVRLDRLFRSSTLFRDKWDLSHYCDGRTYGQATVFKALEGCIVFYTPSSPKVGDHGSPSASSRGPSGKSTTARVRGSHSVGHNNGTNGYGEGADSAHSSIATANGTAAGSPSSNGSSAPSPPSPPSIPSAETPENGESSGGNGHNGGSSIASPTTSLDRQVGQQIAPFQVAEAQGRAQGLAINERVLTAQEAAKLLKISVRLLRETVRPWKRFGLALTGDRWLLSHLLERDLDDGL